MEALVEAAVGASEWRFLCDYHASGNYRIHDLGTSDFQSEVGEAFGEIGGELPAKFGRDFRAFFAGKILGRPVCRTKLPRKDLISKRKMVRKTTRNFPEKL